MGVHVPHQRAEAVPQEESDGKPRGVRRDAEDVKRALRVDAELAAGQTVCETPQSGTQVLLREGAVLGFSEKRVQGKALIRRVCALRPADNRSVANKSDVLPVREQMVQRGGLGKRGV